jgi:hypothetical protein
MPLPRAFALEHLIGLAMIVHHLSRFPLRATELINMQRRINKSPYQIFYFMPC